MSLLPSLDMLKTDDCRAAKLSLLNFLSLFRDLQKPTRFSGRGGLWQNFSVISKSRRDSVGG